MAKEEEKTSVALEVDSGDNENVATKKKCCNCFDGNQDAIGYAVLAACRGTIIMSNVFMSSSLLWLASEAAGCGSEEQGACTKRIYGFYPSSLNANIALISGLLSAFLMPIFGAMVDFTPYRRAVGIASAVVITIIQAVQIYSVSSTWFPMLILQAIAGFFYQIQVVAVYSYLVDMARQLGEAKMNGFSSTFTSIQFSSQAGFLLIVTVISIVIKSSSVVTAQISQGINTLCAILLFGFGWFKYMTPRPAAKELREGRSLLLAGFRQNLSTAKNVNSFFKKGLRWYFLALTFAEASASALVTLSVIYLGDSLKMSGAEIGIFFLITLVSTLPGTVISWWVTKRTNPNTSWKFANVYLFVAVMIGCLILEGLPKYCAYIWGVFVGLGLGWFYPTENLFFSIIMPKGQEAEMAGFYVYCSVVLSWLPPLVFTLLMEVNMPQKYGVIVVGVFFLVAAACLMFTSPWEEIVEETTSGALAAAEAATANSGTEEAPAKEAGEKAEVSM